MSFDGWMQAEQALGAKKAAKGIDQTNALLQALLAEQRRTNALLEYHIAARGGTPPPRPEPPAPQRKGRK